MIDQKKFCMAPFKTAVIDRDGVMLPCCDYMPTLSQRSQMLKVDNVDHWWKIELQDLRQDMISNKDNPGCHHCKSKEANPNYWSIRQQTNDRYPDLDYNTIGLDSIEIRVSNYCNLKCLMCGSYASSSIADEYKRYESEYNSIGMVMPYEETVRWWDDVETLSKLKNVLVDVKEVQFAGGEPLLVPEVLDTLDQLSPDVSVHFITNLTRLSDKFLTAIKKFQQVKIIVSLEGHGSHNDYIRHGSKWDVIEKNILTLLNCPNVYININHVFQHTSLFALPKLLEFVDGLNLDIRIQEIVYGSYPSPGVLTINSALPEDVERFKTWLDTYQGSCKELLDVWVRSYKFDQELHDRFVKYVNMLDKIRGCDFHKTFRT
jgi:sulfatase maturation enzyme AslB (radical SAM superfamily)